MRSVQGHMPKPGPDGVDVHAGAKQVDRARMSKTVGANALGRKRRQRPTRLTNGTCGQNYLGQLVGPATDLIRYFR